MIVTEAPRSSVTTPWPAAEPVSAAGVIRGRPDRRSGDPVNDNDNDNDAAKATPPPRWPRVFPGL